MDGPCEPAQVIQLMGESGKVVCEARSEKSPCSVSNQSAGQSCFSVIAGDDFAFSQVIEIDRRIRPQGVKKLKTQQTKTKIWRAPQVTRRLPRTSRTLRCVGFAANAKRRDHNQPLWEDTLDF
jgi:hypothetical protein